MGERHLQINASRLLVRHLDVNGKQIHAMEKRLDHSWAVVA